MAPDRKFPTLENDLILRAARGEKVERVPVWIMRQAGRYLPEFQEVRKQHDFFQICRTPELACKITLQPIERFKLDAAIIFSDILVIPQALGMDVEMKPGVGPHFPKPLNSPSDISNLTFPVNVQEKLGYVFEAITLTRHSLKGKVPLIGFTGAPWTLMSYMIEGGGSRTMSKSKSWLYKYPEESHRLLQILTDVCVDCLIGQVEAGAQMVQVFESHAEILGPELFQDFALPYIKQISKRVKEGVKKKKITRVPMTIFAKGGHYALAELGTSGYDVISLDWTIDPKVARKLIGNNIILQGNLDPCALYGSRESLMENVLKMIRQFGTQNYIANLGHGIYPDMDPESVDLFITSVREISQTINLTG